jgi:hypothetical protein
MRGSRDHLVGQLEQQTKCAYASPAMSRGPGSRAVGTTGKRLCAQPGLPEVLGGNPTVDFFFNSPFPYIDFFKVGHPFRMILRDFVQDVL